MIKLLILCLICIQTDWPRWGGSKRDFSVPVEIGAIDDQRPLVQLWKQPVGEGYSGLVLSGDRLVSQSRDGSTEFIFALDVGSGREIWRHRYDAPPIESMIPRYGYGPHSTPCASGNYVCAVGGTGIVHVLNLQNGKVVWSKNIWEEYEATKVERGYCSSPIVHKGKLILPVGGKGSGVVAFDIETGKELWKSTDCKACYTSSFVAEFHGQKHLVCLMDQALIGIDPDDGMQLWRYDYPPFMTIHVTSPLMMADNRVFFLSSNEATMIRVNHDAKKEKFSVEMLWQSQAITPQVGNVIVVDDQLIGPSKTMNAMLTGISQQNGKRLWRSRISNAGFLYKCDDGFVSVNDRGIISFNKMVKGKPVSQSKVNLNLHGRIWNTAAFSEDKMFVRDSENILALKIERAK